MNKSIEIICIGNELLTGHTVNTNATWLSGEITRAGGIVRRVTVVRDELDEISNSIKESLERKPRYLITSGGLGPTYDDKTLQGLGAALGKELIVNKDAVSMLRRKYRRTKNASITPPRYKMAKLPKNSKPLDNPIGHAPGVMINHVRCTIFALPGVPNEMEAIFNVYVLPILRKQFGKFVRKEITLQTSGVVESLLAPYLDEIVTKNPEVYVKSHPKGYEKGVSTLHINISAEGRTAASAQAKLKKAVADVMNCIDELHGTVRRI